jgi:hypothetical protein
MCLLSLNKLALEFVTFLATCFRRYSNLMVLLPGLHDRGRQEYSEHTLHVHDVFGFVYIATPSQISPEFYSCVLRWEILRGGTLKHSEMTGFP